MYVFILHIMCLIIFEEKAEIQDQYPLSLNPVQKAEILGHYHVCSKSATRVIDQFRPKRWQKKRYLMELKSRYKRYFSKIFLKSSTGWGIYKYSGTCKIKKDSHYPINYFIISKLIVTIDYAL